MDSGNDVRIRKEDKERSLSSDRTRYYKRLPSRERRDKQPSHERIDRQTSRERLDKQPSRERLNRQTSRERLDKPPSRKRLSRSPRRNKDNEVGRSRAERHEDKMLRQRYEYDILCDKRSLSPEIINIKQSNKYDCSSKIVTEQNIGCDKYDNNIGSNSDKFCDYSLEHRLEKNGAKSKLR